VADQGDQSFSGLGGWNFMVNAGSEDKLEEIWAFVDHGLHRPRRGLRLVLLRDRS
jgi:hypothetical protein